MKKLFSILTLLFALCGYGQYATEITVDQAGHGDFTSIQEAIYATKAFPEKDITIHIKNGVYKEKVTIYSWNNRLTLIGENADSTIITFDDHFDKINLGRNSTFHTHTLKVDANDVTLKNLTIENTAGPVGQAVALHLEGDRIQVINCKIHGNQDTIYGAGEGFRQYFNHCKIDGTTDFIFGEATMVFEKCTIISKSNSYITAASTPTTSEYGFVFIECDLGRLDKSVDEVYLGRPWRSFAKTVYINCKMDSYITPSGWNNWGSAEKEKTVFYGEYQSKGPGANNQNRVSWSHILTKKDATKYQLKNIFGNWQP